MMSPIRPTLLALLAFGFMSGHALAMSQAEYKTSQEQITSQYKADKAQCASLKGNAEDVCKKEAEGKKDTAQANLKAQHQPSEDSRYKAREVKAKADYEVAKEKCDDLAGNAKDVCQKDAKASYVAAQQNAKVTKAAETPNDNRTEKAADVAQARKNAATEKNEASYEAAKQQCDAMSGDAQDKCVADAKRKFGQQ